MRTKLNKKSVPQKNPKVKYQTHITDAQWNLVFLLTFHSTSYDSIRLTRLLFLTRISIQR